MDRKQIVSLACQEFVNTWKADERNVDWEHLIREINAGHGTLIVERFSFKGPIRVWRTGDDWLTMARETSFDAVRDWCHSKYTSNTGTALLVDGSNGQWRTIRGNGHHSRSETVSHTWKFPRREPFLKC